MNPLQIHILAGQQAGARLQLNQSPVTFGRAGDCTLILDLPVASRLHGELQVDEEGQWVLVNHSSNGTRVGRKKATKKPIALTEGVTITIGDTEVFRVHLTPASAEAEAQEAEDDYAEQPDQPAAGAGMKSRSKLWIGLGVWFALILLLVVFLSTLGGDEDGPGTTSAGFYYPGRDVEAANADEAGRIAIKRLLEEPPDYEDPDAARYTRYLDAANQAADRGSSELYIAYENYKLAITYANDRDKPFSDSDVLRYDRILTELSKIIHQYYMEAYRAYNTSRFEDARKILEELREKYYRTPDQDDELANHIRKLRDAAQRRAN